MDETELQEITEKQEVLVSRVNRDIRERVVQPEEKETPEPEVRLELTETPVLKEKWVIKEELDQPVSKIP